MSLDALLAKLRRECEILRGHVKARELATDDELADAVVRPLGEGEEVDAEHAWRWVRAYATLSGLCRREEWVSPQDGAEEEALAALSDDPERVDFVDGEHVYVYPKSMHALLWFRGRDYMLDWMREHVDALRSAITEGDVDKEQVPSPMALLDAVTDELCHHMAAMAYAATTEGVGIPDDVDEPPPECLNMDVYELLRVHQAFWKVNAGRMAVVDRLVGPRKPGGGGRVSWNVFYGTLSMRMKRPVTEMARDHSLVSLLAQLHLSQTPGLKETVEDAT